MQEHDQEQDKMVNRRGFLRIFMWWSVVLALVESGVVGLISAWPRRTTAFGGQVAAGALTDFPIGSVTKITEGRFFLSRLPEGMIALHWQCTHLGCTVPWVPSENQFVCPCHGSQFDQSGRNLSGPAPRPLDYMPLEIHEGQVIVNTAVVRRRQNHLDEHITPV